MNIVLVDFVRMDGLKAEGKATFSFCLGLFSPIDNILAAAAKRQGAMGIELPPANAGGLLAMMFYNII